MPVFRLAALAACLFAVSGSMAAPFPSSSRTTAVARVAAGSGIVPYQEVSGKPKCPIATTCIVTFPAITDSGVFIQHISCGFAIKTGGTAAVALLTIQGQSPFNMVSPNKTAAFIDGDASIYTVNAQTDLFVDTGQQPEVNVSSTAKAVKNLICTISGFHV